MDEVNELKEHPLEVICAAAGLLAAPASAFFGTHLLSNSYIASAAAAAATFVPLSVIPLSNEYTPSLSGYCASAGYFAGTVVSGLVKQLFPHRRSPQEPLEQVLRSSKHWNEPNYR